jgi:putative ABC transport system substrate-binding protein
MNGDVNRLGNVTPGSALSRSSGLSVQKFAEDAGLISYGSSPIDIFRRAASYVDRILKGASAAELPIQAPTKFELVINLRTAKALGLEVAAHC